MITTVIFDMNGVITDDEEIHEIATKEVFEDIGFDLTSEKYREFCLGRTDLASFKDLFVAFGIKEGNMESLIAKKSQRYQILIQNNLKVYPGVLDLIISLSKKYTLALTSSSTFDEVYTVVNQLDIKHLFKTIVTSRDVKYGKPMPEPYLLTAERLEVNPENCLVIEDSENGVKSAKSAGMKCVAISNTEQPSRLIKADQIIDNYDIITDKFIQYF
ncbi:MAG: HAD family phosphatase [Flavobacteriaceae bacterium]|nr:HAD family phosphatase [Flavobacteriaceae bacterium]